MVKVLEVFREPIANGGQESFIMNMYRNMDHSKIVMDFMTPFTCDNTAMKEEIESYGGRVFAYNHPFGEKNNQVFSESLKDFLKTHSYETVHFHSGSTYALMMGPKIASEAGVRNRIVHSHCGGDRDLKYRVIKTLSVPYFMKYPTEFCACSKLAAEWKFPKKIVSAHQVRYLKNAVDLDRFSWNPDIRKKTREEMGVLDETVIGHVGRFSRQKNHDFLIEIFFAYLQRHPDAQLWLIGEGEEEERIRQKVADLNIGAHVRFLGLRRDIPALMNAMDVFVLPSLFEGLPVVGVEAQAVSLPVIASDQVARELPVPELSSYLPLDDEQVIRWVEEIEQTLQFPRTDRRKELSAAGYEVKSAARKMQDFYISISEPQTDRQGKGNG